VKKIENEEWKKQKAWNAKSIEDENANEPVQKKIEDFMLRSQVLIKGEYEGLIPTCESRIIWWICNNVDQT
jgi:hypothetical protein